MKYSRKVLNGGSRRTELETRGKWTYLNSGNIATTITINFLANFTHRAILIKFYCWRDNFEYTKITEFVNVPMCPDEGESPLPAV